MHKNDTASVFIVTLGVLMLSACDGAGEGGAADPRADADRGAAPSPPTDELGVPIELDYSIIGNPVVGQPVGIDVLVSSAQGDRVITLHYRVDEVGSITFPESQAASAELMPSADGERRSQPVTVIPQREGRVFLVVSAEIETDDGDLAKSIAIPIQVARAPAAPEVEADEGNNASR